MKESISNQRKEEAGTHLMEYAQDVAKMTCLGMKRDVLNAERMIVDINGLPTKKTKKKEEQNAVEHITSAKRNSHRQQDCVTDVEGRMQILVIRLVLDAGQWLVKGMRKTIPEVLCKIVRKDT